MSRGCTQLATPLTVLGALESWPHLSPAAALWRRCASPLELALVGGVWVSQPKGISVKSLITTYLLWGGTGDAATPDPLCHLQPLGKLPTGS